MFTKPPKFPLTLVYNVYYICIQNYHFIHENHVWFFLIKNVLIFLNMHCYITLFLNLKFFTVNLLNVLYWNKILLVHIIFFFNFDILIQMSKWFFSFYNVNTRIVVFKNDFTKIYMIFIIFGPFIQIGC